MTCSNKTLALTAIFSIALAITGCIVTPNNQNGSSNPYRSSSNYSNSVQVSIDDLRNGSDVNANQQLYARCFNEIYGLTQELISAINLYRLTAQ